MTEKGHFEKGLWVVDREPPAPRATEDAMEKRLSDATKAAIASVDNVMNVTRDLVTTDEGKRYIEKTLQDTQKQLQLSFDSILSRAKAELVKTKAGLDRKAAELDKTMKR
jgi:hypothetical protein